MKQLQLFKNPSPNPQPGMIWGSAHFLQEQAFIRELAACYFANTRNSAEFGLLAYPYNVPESFNLEVLGDTLQLQSCFACTTDGALILIDSRTPCPQLNLAPYKEGTYEIFVVTSFEATEPFGLADSNESPRRQPFRIPRTHLELHPTSAVQDPASFPSSLKLGQLKKEGDTFTLLESLPPCLQIAAHPQVARKYHELCKTFGDLVDYSSKITRKTRVDSRHRQLHSIFYLAERLGFFLVQHRHSFLGLGHKGSVKQMIGFWIALAASLRFCIASLDNETEVLELFSYYTQSMPGFRFEMQGFKDRILNLADLQYDPHQLKEHFQVIDEFTDHFSIVWRRLAEATRLEDQSQGSGLRIIH